MTSTSRKTGTSIGWVIQINNHNILSVIQWPWLGLLSKVIGYQNSYIVYLFHSTSSVCMHWMRMRGPSVLPPSVPCQGHGERGFVVWCKHTLTHLQNAIPCRLTGSRWGTVRPLSGTWTRGWSSTGPLPSPPSPPRTPAALDPPSHTQEWGSSSEQLWRSEKAVKMH